MSRILNQQQKNQQPRMLFQQVDNSSLDQMNYNLWNNLSFDPDYSIRSLFNNDDPFWTESLRNEDDDHVSSVSSRSTSIPSPSSTNTTTITTNNNNNNDSDDSEPQDSNSNAMMITVHGDSSLSGLVDNDSNGPMCTLYIDMTYDDRVFFGVHNFFILKYSLSKTQCNVDFAAPNNKVSIMGSVANVEKMSRSFFGHSTLALQFNFQFYCEANFREFLNGSFKQFQKDNEKWDVYVTYRLNQPNVMMFNFLTFKKYFLQLARTICSLQMQLHFYQLGRVIPDIMSTLQIPVMRRDSNGINSAYIETIEKQTNTQIKTIRYTECQQYPFENVIITGKDIFQVAHARVLLTARFEYELKFQVPTNDTGLLVHTVSNLKYDRNAIDVTISPSTSNCLEMKIISIKSVEENFQKIFQLRQELLHMVHERLVSEAIKNVDKSLS